MNTTALKIIGLVVLTSQLALANTTKMSEVELKQAKLGLRTALTQQAAKKCVQVYSNTINGKTIETEANCVNDISSVIIIRLDSAATSESSWDQGFVIDNQDGTISLKLSKSISSASTNKDIQLSVHELLVRLNAAQNQITQIYLRSVVKVKGQNTNAGTILNPKIEPTVDTYEDTVHANF